MTAVPSDQGTLTQWVQDISRLKQIVSTYSCFSWVENSEARDMMSVFSHGQAKNTTGAHMRDMANEWKLRTTQKVTMLIYLTKRAI
jgi:hypothetical protein